MEKNKTDKNKFVGICKVGEKGQIVIPKEIRTMFDINPGDSVIVLCDKEKGIRGDVMMFFKYAFVKSIFLIVFNTLFFV